jgi:diguanylate cyclase (GGDEF)-like protein
MAVWYANSTLGFSISFISALVWLFADITVGEEYSRPIIYFWNTLIRFAFFLVVTYLLSKLRESQREVQILARTDFMTGTYNSRYFHELLGRELGRSNRYKHPFTLVYLDLDNFKQVNDRFGHTEGDRLISFIATELKRQVRTTDIVSRLGGDEFAILFPEAGQQEARLIIAKICNHITQQLSGEYSFVTFSAGAVTYIATPDSIAETIKIADDLMYSVKNSTKNGVRYSLYNG